MEASITTTTRITKTTTRTMQPSRVYFKNHHLLLIREVAVASLLLMMVMFSFIPATEAAAAAAPASANEARQFTPDGITCPPESDNERGPTLEEIYYHSDVVVMGKVTEHYHRRGQVYTAEMDVYCVYKGDNVAAHINITNAGSMPNLCFTADFKVGLSYMAYLKRHSDGRLSPAYKQHPDGYKDEMGFICDVIVSLPVGLTELPDDVVCEYKDYSYDDSSDYEGDEEKKNVTCFSFDPEKDKDKTYRHAEGNDNQDGGDVRKGQVKDDDDDDNGCGPLRLSLLLLALLHAVVLVFS